MNKNELTKHVSNVERLVDDHTRINYEGYKEQGGLMPVEVATAYVELIVHEAGVEYSRLGEKLSALEGLYSITHEFTRSIERAESLQQEQGVLSDKIKKALEGASEVLGSLEGLG